MFGRGVYAAGSCVDGVVVSGDGVELGLVFSGDIGFGDGSSVGKGINIEYMGYLM